MSRFAAPMIQDLEISIVKQGMPGITPIIGSYLYENCVVCLYKAGHTDGVALQINGLCDDSCILHWDDKITDQMLRSYQDDQETTEQGAVGLSILLSQQLTDFNVIERSWKGTGIDYWLGYKEDPLFQRAARLEVSGIRTESATNNIATRYEQKVDQVKRSDNTMLPVYISIVEFGTPKCLFNTK